MLLLDQRGLARQPRAARLRDPPPLPGTSDAAFPEGLRSGAAVSFVDDNSGATERGDLGRGGVAFKRKHIATGTAGAGVVCNRRRRRPKSQRLFRRRQRGPGPNTAAGAPSGLGCRGRAAVSSVRRVATASGAAGFSSAAASAGGRNIRSVSGTAAARASSSGFSATGGSMRSKARVGIGVVVAGRTPARASPAASEAGKFLMRGAQQGRRAKPEDQDRHRQDDRGEQETKTGEHGREFRLACILQGY